MILEMHDTLENLFAFRMRARDEVAGVEKPKMLTFHMGELFLGGIVCKMLL